MAISRGIWVIGAAVFTIGFSTTLAMPLFTTYAARDGQGAGGLSAAFIAYAASAIISAPLLGGMSDRIGRKPCILAALALTICGTIALITAPGLAALAFARGAARQCVRAAGAREEVGKEKVDRVSKHADREQHEQAAAISNRGDPEPHADAHHKPEGPVAE